MKSIIYSFITCITLLSTGAYANTQDDIANKQAIQMLKEFYTAYNIAWSIPVAFEIHSKKLYSLQKEYCTIRLRNELKDLDLDHDPLIKDGYTDAEHINTLAVIKDTTKANGYIVSYMALTTSPANKPILEKVTIYVTVIKEGDSLKIASVR